MPKAKGMSDRIYPGEIKPQRHFTGHSRILQDSSYFLALGRFRMKTKLPERPGEIEEQNHFTGQAIPTWSGEKTKSILRNEYIS
jgi:hypothetical protein